MKKYQGSRLLTYFLRVIQASVKCAKVSKENTTKMSYTFGSAFAVLRTLFQGTLNRYSLDIYDYSYKILILVITVASF